MVSAQQSLQSFLAKQESVNVRRQQLQNQLDQQSQELQEKASVAQRGLQNLLASRRTGNVTRASQQKANFIQKEYEKNRMEVENFSKAAEEEVKQQDIELQTAYEELIAINKKEETLASSIQKKFNEGGGFTQEEKEFLKSQGINVESKSQISYTGKSKKSQTFFDPKSILNVKLQAQLQKYNQVNPITNTTLSIVQSITAPKNKIVSQNPLENFFNEKQQAAQKIIDIGYSKPVGKEFGLTGPALITIGSGVQTLFSAGKLVAIGTGSLVGVPEAKELAIKTRREIITTASEAQKDFPGFVKKIAKQTGKDIVEKPFETIGSGLVLQNLTTAVISPVVKPISRFVNTKATRISESQFPAKIDVMMTEGAIPQSSLQSILNRTEGQVIDVVHASRRLPLDTPTQRFTELFTGKKPSVVLTAQKAGVGKARATIEEFSFFRSIPLEGSTKPNILLQFAGIGEKTSEQAKTVFTLTKPRAKAFIETVKVSRISTSPNENVISILAKQEARPGETFVGAQNLAKLTKEEQVTTPVRVQPTLVNRITGETEPAFPKTGRPATIGSILVTEERLGTVFARMKIESPKFLPKIIRESDLFVESEPISIIRTKTIPFGDIEKGLSGNGIRDISKLNRKVLSFSETSNVLSSESVRFVSGSDIIRRIGTTSIISKLLGSSLKSSLAQDSSSRTLKTSKNKSGSGESLTIITNGSSIISSNFTFPQLISTVTEVPPTTTTSINGGSSTRAVTIITSSVNQPLSSYPAKSSASPNPFVPSSKPASSRTITKSQMKEPSFTSPKGFDVLVKKNIKGKEQFVEIDPHSTSFSERDAIIFGQNAIDRGIEASFRIRESNSPIVELRGLDALDYKFRVSRRPGSKSVPVYVEIEGNRLDTKSEVMEITAARIAKSFNRNNIVRPPKVNSSIASQSNSLSTKLRKLF